MEGHSRSLCNGHAKNAVAGRPIAGASNEVVSDALDPDRREPAFDSCRRAEIEIAGGPHSNFLSATKNPAHEALSRMLKERQVLEKFKEFLSPLRLPRALRLKLQGCDGVSNAWYGDDAITVCYEYIDDILRNAPEEKTPAGVTRADAIVGPTLEVFLHEVGHAVFDYLDVPILGREEDAADQFAGCSSQKAMHGG